MGLTLDQVVPWGRSGTEYLRMFALQPMDLQRRILDCAAGPASFNAEMTQQGHCVISCDPMYDFSTDQIAARITATCPVILAGVQANRAHYLWQEIATPEQLVTLRLSAMHQFLQDFAAGKQAGRYITAALPHLPFADRQFDLALCSHFLFAYADLLGWEFHQAAIAELCRVAQEVRIFPLLTIAGEPCPFVPRLQAELHQRGYTTHIHLVTYEFQKGGNQLLQVCSNG